MYTWLIWAITQGTATVAILYGGGNFEALSTAVGTIFVIVIFLLDFKYGTRNVTKNDTVLLILALLALFVWWQLHNPVLAVLMITGIDAIGCIPTIRKTLEEPWSETPSFWILMAIVNILMILSATQYNFFTMVYVVMLLVANITIWTICLVGNKNLFKGTIIENSLSDKSILKKLKIENTSNAGDWTLDDVLLNKNKIPELSKYLADGPWYIHLWQPGKDEVKIVFKNKIFTIQHSDKSTWENAITYGKALGIPEEQLDFPIK